jgi:NRPS condensation-like uncharacterized protein
MKIEFKSDNTKIKISYEGLLDDNSKDKLLKTISDIYKNKDNPLEVILDFYKIKNNPFETMFSKSDLDLYKEIYQKFPYNIISFYKDINKAFEKYINMNKPDYENAEDKPDILPANGHDIFNYIARYGMANFQIQAIMQLDGRLDFDKLSRAVRLSVDAEPVFGCRFVESDSPYWRRLDNIDKIQFCFFEETDNPDEAIQSFLESPLDMDNDPMVKVKLIRSDQYDTLGIKINHACCDGAGTKEYIQLLSEIYSHIDQDNDAFVPEPRIGGRKDQDRLFSELGITDLDAAWIPGSEILMPTWTFPWKQGGSNITRVTVCRLPNGQLNEMTNFAKARGATINDLILTAFYRAMLEMGQPIYGFPMEIPITVDLRRYLPDNRTEAIRNFSGSVSTSVPMIANEPFCETLSRVVSVMNEIKNGYPGLQSAIGLERIEKISFSETLAYYQVPSKIIEMALQCPTYCGDKCIPTLSNLGFITKSLLKFGANVVTDAYIVPPVVRVPGFLLMVSTYNSIITLAIDYYEATISKDEIEKLLNLIKDELVENCRL